MKIDREYLLNVVSCALAEDIGDGDITTAVSVDASVSAVGKITARKPLIVAGIPLVSAVFMQMDDALSVEVLIPDGSFACKNDIIAIVQGPAAPILTGERVALNFIQRLSGIATITAEFVKRTEGTGVQILDTRKTIPGWRLLEKYAVSMGGGTNHRFGLYDRFLFKDNHLAVGAPDLAKDIASIIKKAREYRPDCKVEVEVDTLEQLKKVLPSKPDIVLLDNFSLADLRAAVSIAGESVFLEASGGVTLETVRDIALTGVNGISVGALTHSAPAVDIALDLELC